MNVKSLKEMFEKKGPIEKEQPKKQQPKRLNLPNVPVSPSGGTFAINIEDKPAQSARSSKNFFEQLNKKLANRQSISPPQPLLKSRVSDPAPVIKQIPTIEQKTENQLSFDDILTKAQRKQSGEFNTNSRYGLHENTSVRSRQKTIHTESFDYKGMPETTSFSAMLEDMLHNINKKQSQKDQGQSEVFAPQKLKKAQSQIEYEQTYKNYQSKLNRIDFVIRVAFGNQQFENIQPDNDRIRSTKQSEKIEKTIIQPIVASFLPEKPKEIVVDEIIKDKNQEKDQITLSSSSKRPCRVSQQFLNQLTSKIFKKSLNTSKIEHKDTQIHATQPNLQKEQPDEGLAPRQKKKPKKRQQFDDF